MINYSPSTVFNTKAKAIVNAVNTVGVMGAGVALEFALRYPEMFEDYKTKCENHEIAIGKVGYYHDSSGTTIVNFPTKWHFMYPSQLKWIEKALDNFVETYKSHGITSVAFPKLGTFKGQLPWEQVKPIMVKYLSPLKDIDIIICLDEEPNAEGKEKQMVDAYNNTNIDLLPKDKIKLTTNQKEALKSFGQIQRFWHLQNCEGIATKTYANLFKYFYNKNYDEQELITCADGQIGLFDELGY